MVAIILAIDEAMGVASLQRPVAEDAGDPGLLRGRLVDGGDRAAAGSLA
jgi:hypothetical protein